MTALPNKPSSKHWWRDQVARLIITIIGGVTAAVILVFVIPSISNSDPSTDNPDGQTEQPVDSGEAPTEEPATTQAPAEGG